MGQIIYFLTFIYLFVHMNILHACISMYYAYDCYPLWTEKGIRSPGSGVIDSCEPLYGSLQEQQALLIAECS